MTRRLKLIWAVLTSVLITLTGCHPSQPFYLFNDGDLSHYVDKAIAIDYPDAETTQLAEIENAKAPLTLNNPEPQEIWELKLEEAIKIALANSKVVRTLPGRFTSNGIINPTPPQATPPDQLITTNDTSRTVYDPAITETTPGTGVEAALSAFDAQWTASMQGQHNLHPQNVNPGSIVSGFVVPIFKEDNTTFNTALTKITATGGQFAVTNNIFYDNVNTKTVDTPYTSSTNVQLTFNQPLLAGGGVQYNRIAGPFNPFAGIISSSGSTVGTTAFDGVLLARINTDISLADFEGTVRNMLSDVENAYWSSTSATATWKPRRRHGPAPWPLGGKFMLCTSRVPVVVKQKRKPRPVPSTSNSAATCSSHSTRCSRRKTSCATCWAFRYPTVASSGRLMNRPRLRSRSNGTISTAKGWPAAWNSVAKSGASSSASWN